MIKIGAHIPGPFDATNWYRGTGPLGHLRKAGRDAIDFQRIQEWSFASIQAIDIAFFQRPSTKGELEAIRICKRLNVPVIVDYDDLLFDLPTDNPVWAAYMNKETHETIISCISEADVVWTSTSELKRCFQISDAASLNKRVYVVPNALDDLHLVTGARSLPPPPKNRQPSVIWRGSPTHERDVMDYTPEIGDVAANNLKTSFVFVGWNPWFLTERMAPKQAICSGALGVGEFMDFMYATGSKVGMVPLHDSRFNRCKSNIAWLEMTWSGSVVLAPDWEEWRHPGVMNYKSAADFGVKLQELITMPNSELEKMHRASWNHIVKNFTLTTSNKIRSETIRAALGLQEWPSGWDRLPDADESVMELE